MNFLCRHSGPRSIVCHIELRKYSFITKKINNFDINVRTDVQLNLKQAKHEVERASFECLTTIELFTTIPRRSQTSAFPPQDLRQGRFTSSDFLFLHNSYTIVKIEPSLRHRIVFLPFSYIKVSPLKTSYSLETWVGIRVRNVSSLFFSHSSDSYKARKIARLVLICSWSVAAIAQVEMLCLLSSNWLRRWNFLIRKRCHLWRIAQRLSGERNFRFAVYMIEREIEFPKSLIER